ncbi:DUF3558 family protein [uncultured Corynebacterium sp.]|uniref:DUF3558 family protein n=1 Tax=uncultured Corynebacterium sp. TaxID=159447 RepID=UPI0025FD23ED|nr:DUF3558 family protein [uncultured Corynebacterium sp.]
MKRIGGLVLGAVACTGVLASCALPGGLGARVHGGESGGLHDFADGQSGGGSADSGVADVTATTVEESDAAADDADTGRGVLPPLGTFDRTVPGFRVFDPCSELSGPHLEAMGLEVYGEARRESGFRSCDFLKLTEEGNSDITIESRQQKLDDVKRAFPEEFPGVETEGRNFYAVEDTFIPDISCTVYAETVRGLVSVTWSELAGEKSMLEKCNQASRVMLDLYRLKEG